MDIQVSTPAWEISTIQLTFNSSYNLVSKPRDIQAGVDSIKSKNTKVTFVGAIADNSNLTFKVKSEETGTEEILNF